jgi:hypothetical protein
MRFYIFHLWKCFFHTDCQILVNVHKHMILIEDTYRTLFWHLPFGNPLHCRKSLAIEGYMEVTWFHSWMDFEIWKVLALKTGNYCLELYIDLGNISATNLDGNGSLTSYYMF